MVLNKLIKVLKIHQFYVPLFIQHLFQSILGVWSLCVRQGNLIEKSTGEL